ncbi:MAG TPA: DUF350 domain-containing protein [Syntrophorhabdaceae bacterium]|jgi:uncharacterized membrane protein YjfL (UPF0719 family)
MWKILGNVIEIFVYSAVFMVVALVCLKVTGSIFTPDFEKKIVEEGNIGLAIVCGCLFIGLALVVSSVMR